MTPIVIRTVDDIFAVVSVPLSLHMAIDKAKADGKIDLADLPLLVDPLMKLIPAIPAVTGAMEKIKTLTPQERMDLNAKIKAVYDIADDELEAKVEEGMALLLHIGQFVGML